MDKIVLLLVNALVFRKSFSLLAIMLVLFVKTRLKELKIMKSTWKVHKKRKPENCCVTEIKFRRLLRNGNF